MAPTTGGLFNPENFSSGGFLDDVDVTIVGSQVVTQEDTPFDAQEEDSCFIQVDFLPDGGSDEDTRHEYYRVGSVEKFTPSPDKTRVVANEGARMNKNTKAALFFNALINAGFPASDIPADASVTFLKGIRAHVNAVPMPEMKGGGKNQDRFKGKDGEKKQATVVVITKLLEAAPAKGAKKTAAAKPGPKAVAKAAPAAAAAEASDDAPSVDTQAENAIVQLLIEQGGTVNKKLVPTEMLKRIKDATARTKSFKLVGDDAWLGAGDRPWDYDAGKAELTMSDATATRAAEL